MRDVYIVAYDIRNPKRLRRVFKVTKGYGEHLQYSVFLCRLDTRRLRELKERLEDEIKPEEDQILLVRLGPENDLRHLAFSTLGQPLVIRERVPMII